MLLYHLPCIAHVMIFWFNKETLRDILKTIYIHFTGAAAEWFWENLNHKDSSASKYMKEYEAPKFTYQDFGSQLTMEFFNATRVAEVVHNSGAK